ncbi:MAG: acireductone synthase [Pyrinomonadaceae bacterium]
MIMTILLDIEGTTTPIDFVHKTLFPFAAEHLAQYITANFADLGREIEELTAEHSVDDEYTGDLDTSSADSVSAYLKFLIERDRKSTPLKSIQGKIWKAGYENGELRSEIFDDVPPAFNRWRAEGRRIAIYSSGSVLAQKLLFGYTETGDLTPFIDSYFDTNVGAKRETASYRRIAGSLGETPANILFVSDIVAELDAARSSGFSTVLSVRPGNAPEEGGHAHPTITSFDEIA